MHIKVSRIYFEIVVDQNLVRRKTHGLQSNIASYSTSSNVVQDVKKLACTNSWIVVMYDTICA